MRERLKTITVRLVLLCVVIIIPINIIVAGIANYAISQMRKQLYQVKEDEVRLQMTRIDQSISLTEERLMDHLQEYYLRLSSYSSEGNYPISSTIYESWSKLKEIRLQMEYVSFVFLITNWDGKVYISYDNEKYEFTDCCHVEDYLQEGSYDPYQSLYYEPVIIDDSLYFMYTSHYSNFTMGYLVDAKSVLETVAAVAASKNEKYILVDTDGITTTGETFDLSKQVQKLNIEGKTDTYYIIPCMSENIQIGVVRMIPMSDMESSENGDKVLVWLLVLLCLLAIPILIIFIDKLVLKPIRAIVIALEEIQADNIEYRMDYQGTTKEFETVSENFNKMASEIRNLRIESYEKDIQKLEIEKGNLRLQMNPHLLLNSLNIIYSMIQAEKTSTALKYILHLVEYFRYVLRKNEELVPMEQEIQFVKNYLEIQAVRFPDKFSFVYDVEKKAEKAMIPALLVQNFIENSVKYGMKMQENIEIILQVTCRDEKLQISICDTGNGIAEERLQKIRNGEIIEDEIGKHIGIWNCRKRLELYYQKEVTLSISSILGEGTQVWVEIPAAFQEEREL